MEKAFYSTVEVRKILTLSEARIKKAMKQKLLVPDNIESWRGKQGFRYLFSKDAICKYAEKVGIVPVFDAVDKKVKPDVKKHAEGYSVLFENEKPQEVYEETGVYFVRLGHRYVMQYDYTGGDTTMHVTLTEDISKAHVFKKEYLPDFGEIEALYRRK